MNLKLKQLCIILFSTSLLGQSIAAPTGNKSPSESVPAAGSNNNQGGKATPIKSNLLNNGNNAASYSSKKAFNNDGNNSSNANSATGEDKVVLNFENADIQTVIKAISKLSGKNFVIDPRVKGTVNIVSERPISKADSYKVLESALRMQGFATVEADGVIKVLPETDARTYGMRMENQKTGDHDPGDQLVTKVFPIDNGSATQLANTLRPMISPNNTINVYQNSNALVVTDYSSNMAKISAIIKNLNTSKATRVAPAVIKLRYAVAADVAQTLQSYAGNGSMSGGGPGGGGGGGPNDGPTVSITVDPNSNSVIISSNVAAKVEELRNLALNLDRDSSSSNSNMHVVYLRNADAAHVAEVLKVIATGQDNPDITASSASRTLSDTSSMLQGSSSNGSSGGSSMGSSFGASRSPNIPNRSSGGPGSNPNSNDKNAAKILVQAEPTTNSLIIEAPDAVYRNMRTIIDMLDVRRVQVMMEVLIAQVSTTDAGEFGIQWLGGIGNNSTGIGVLSNYGNSKNGTDIGSIAATGIGISQALNGGSAGAAGASGASSIKIPSGVTIGLVTNSVSIGGVTVPGISALANALTSTNAANILSRPTLLTLDNEEASIFVGSNIGIPTGSFQNTGGLQGNVVSQVNRQDVGTALRLKPLVTQNGSIQLSLYQEDSIVDSATQTTQEVISNGPNISKRSLKTEILVNDGQIIALGGMTQDNIQLQSSGIPGLSAIPYLGWLFSWQNRVHTKTNLVLFLRPVIIRNEEGMKALTNQRYRYIMEQQNTIKAGKNLVLPTVDAVTMENQVPYNNVVPKQPATVPDTPVLDLTKGPNNVSVIGGNNNTDDGNNQSPVVVTTSTTRAKDLNTNADNQTTTRVLQTAPNSITITNNNSQ